MRTISMPPPAVATTNDARVEEWGGSVKPCAVEMPWAIKAGTVAAKCNMQRTGCRGMSSLSVGAA
jgi:hypothetical protein